MYNIIQKRKIWISISSAMMIASIIAIAIFGLKLGIDFTGGSLLEVEFSQNRPTPGDATSALSGLNLGSLVVQPIGEKGMILRFQDVTEEKHQEILKKLQEMSAQGEEAVIKELRFDSVGPTIGKELKSKSFSAMVVILLVIVSFIAYAFRHVSRPVESWKYGLAAIIALFHDVLITIGVFAFLGEYYNVEINTPFVAAILTVLGYSVNDTIVVFDRIRENLPKSNHDFEGTVNVAINQTMVRSINTSLATLMTLIAIIFWGGETIKYFALALTIGIFVGTYSSIFLASPILVIWEKMRSK